jgi:hypothetical protein
MTGCFGEMPEFALLLNEVAFLLERTAVSLIIQHTIVRH